MRVQEFSLFRSLHPTLTFKVGYFLFDFIYLFYLFCLFQLTELAGQCLAYRIFFLIDGFK